MAKRIGLDLDGILIGLPPLIPKAVIEYLYKDHGRQKLSYRFPSLFEQKIRQLSHIPGVRPPMRKNCEIIKKAANSSKHRLYVISGRFSFLEYLTHKWLKRYDLQRVFTEIYLNTNNLQPHFFKEHMIEKIKLDIFIDDDFDTIAYLAPRFKQIHFYWYTHKKDIKLDVSNVTAIDDLDTIFK